MYLAYGDVSLMGINMNKPKCTLLLLLLLLATVTIFVVSYYYYSQC